MAKNRLIAIVAILASFFFCLPARAQNPSEDSHVLLSRVKVAILYENITDGVGLGRSIENTVDILKETHANFIFRGFWKWEPIVDSPDQIPMPLQVMAREEGIDNPAQRLQKSGKYYRSLGNWIQAIKWSNPSILFCGAIPAQHMARVEINPMSGRVYTGDETWAMALDPQKWQTVFRDKTETKDQLQSRFSSGITKDYDRRTTKAYFPDLTNPEFQSLLESWAEKQIDLGADAIWIDMLLTQTKLFLNMTNDVNHPAVRESYMAAVKIVDDLHRYGEAKGKAVLIGSWGQGEDSLAALTPTLALDFVTVTPSREEIEKKQIDSSKLEGKLSGIRRLYGNIPVFAFIDWSLDTSPMVSFSQNLNSDEQNKALQVFDAFFAQNGVNFVYPVHGGYMGNNPAKLSFEKSPIYDSFAPQFDTFSTIMALASAKNTSESAAKTPTVLP